MPLQQQIQQVLQNQQTSTELIQSVDQTLSTAKGAIAILSQSTSQLTQQLPQQGQQIKQLVTQLSGGESLPPETESMIDLIIQQQQTYLQQLQQAVTQIEQVFQ